MREIKTPEQWFRELKKRISRSEWAAFYGALIIGLMTHIYAFVNKLYNYDELPNTPGGFIGAGNNRWFLEIQGKVASRVLGGSYSLPFLSGMLTVLLLALSALLVVRMFEVKSTFLAVGIGGFMTSFPAVVSLVCFMFLAPNYAVGIFLSVWAAYFVIRHPKHLLYNLMAVVVLACATGTYQAYFADTACLLMMSIVLICAFGKEQTSWKDIVVLAVRYVAVLGLGMALYFVLNKVLLKLWGIDGALGGYQGLDTMGQITPAELVEGIVKCYRSFLGLFTTNIMYLNNNTLLCHGFRAVVFILVLGIGVVCYLKKGEWMKKILMLAVCLLFPIALFLPYVMAPKADFYALMAYAVVFLPIFALIWTDIFFINAQKEKLLAVLMQWGATGVSVVMLLVYIWYGNGCYMAMEYTKMHDLAYFETLVTQIKSVENYRDEMEVVLIGGTMNDETNRAGSLTGEMFKIGGKAETNVNGASAVYLITKYLGFVPDIAGYEETKEWMEREEVKDMAAYPDDGSIKVIEDTIIVKLSDYEEGQ